MQTHLLVGASLLKWRTAALGVAGTTYIRVLFEDSLIGCIYIWSFANFTTHERSNFPPTLLRQ
jgi:hypothetical protein